MTWKSDGQIAQFVHGEDRRLEVTLEFMFKPANGLCRGECVDDVHGGGEQDRVPAQAGFVSQGAGTAFLPFQWATVMG
jgi:hypothetical protein